MNRVTFATVYLVCLCLYSQTGLDLPGPGARLLVVGTTVWAVCVVYVWVCGSSIGSNRCSNSSTASLTLPNRTRPSS